MGIAAGTRLAAVALACSTLVLAGCSLDRRAGADVAAERADAFATKMAKDFGYLERIRDAEYLATILVDGERNDPDIVRLEVVGWSGRTFGGEQATVDVRIVAAVVDESVGFNEGHTAGEATRCYRFFFRYKDYTYQRGIDCSSAPARTPAPKPVEKLPADAVGRLTKALGTAKPETLESVVRAAFPEPYVVVDTVTQEGALVAAVGVPAERDCVVMVRNPTGEIKQVSFDQIWLEPGELGCSTRLYVSPPR